MAEPVDRLAFDDAVALGALDGTAFAPSRPEILFDLSESQLRIPFL